MTEVNKPLLQVNFKDQIASDHLFPRLPLITSHATGWRGIYIEHHFQPNDWEVPEHYSTQHLISLKLGSTIQSDRWLDGRLQHEFQTKGTIAIIPATVSHRTNWSGSGEFLILAVEPSFLQHIAQGWTDPDRIELLPQFAVQRDPLILELGLALKAELQSGCLGGALYAEAMATTLAAHLLRKYSSFAPVSNISQGLSQAKLRQVLSYMHDRLDQTVSLEELSSLVGMSPHYFLQLFKQSTGLPPHQYLLIQRLQVAQRLLRDTDLSIAEIAYQVGFASQSRFTTVFRQHLAMTPSIYRQQSS